MLTLEVMQKRIDELSNCLTKSEADLDILKERSKIMRKEIANTKGAIMEIEHMIELYY